MEELINTIKTVISLDEQQVKRIQTFFKREKYNKGTILLEGNKVCNKFYFINSGYLRTYFYDDGDESTSWIFSPRDFATVSRSFYNEVPSNDFIEALTDVDICYIEKKDLKDFYKIPGMNEFGRIMLERQVASIDQMYQHIFYTSAKEKYDYVLNKRKDLLEVAQLKHIASMLGIRLETLSRVRAKK